MKVELLEYDPLWPKRFEEEDRLISENFPLSIFQVEHIGSTSIKGLPAKPIIDILFGIPSLSDFSADILAHFSKLGYEYVEKYNPILPERRYFFKEVNKKHTHHLHLTAKGSPLWKRHLYFRDRLRASEELRNAYAALKSELAKKEWEHRNDYADAKNDFIRSVERGQAF
jgi:GrpB-like predicted nucleotidyltransferase (UPF0157 family)